MSDLKITVPDMGDFKDVEIIEVLVKEGQTINKNDSLITLESDKSSVEVPSIYEGKVESVNVKIGDKVSKGDLLITLNSESKLEEKTKEVVVEKIPVDTEKIIKQAEDTLDLEDEIFGVCKTLSINNIKQESNLIDALKITCRKYSKEKTGKKPFTNINLVKI